MKGELERTEGGSITEGIGQGRVTGNLATCEGIIDGAFMVRDRGEERGNRYVQGCCDACNQRHAKSLTFVSLWS